MTMRWALKSWRCWVALLVPLALALLLVLSLRSSGKVLYAGHDIVAAFNPRGGVWIYWGTTRTKEPETIIYSTEGMTYIVTHERDGSAGVQTIAQKSPNGSLPLVRVHRTAVTAFGGGQGLSIVVSLWWLTLVGVLAPAWMVWRLWRKRVRGECRSCGYSRAGLVESAACPECGLVGTM